MTILGYLLNGVNVVRGAQGTFLLKAGTPITDQATATAAQAAGGTVLPPTTALAAASAICSQLIRRGADDATLNGVMLGAIAASLLTNPSLVGSISIAGSTSFAPASPAPAKTAVVDSYIATGQTTAASHTAVVLATLPLPGTAGAPSSTGLLELDVEVSMVSTTTSDAARFKLTWQWSVVTPGSPVALGTLTTSLSVGTNANNPPSGWTAALQLDGGSDNAQVVVSGDTALTVDCKALIQYGYTA
jgi:hypothetical protein